MSQTRNSKGQFLKGMTPWNKGLHRDLSHGKGHFKKGEMPPKHKQVGYIRHQKDGYVYIKVAEPRKWQLYQRYIWEKAHGKKLNKSDIVIFLDGNKENFDPKNLEVINRKELMILNHEGLLVKQADISKVHVMVARLKVRIKDLKAKRSNNAI